MKEPATNKQQLIPGEFYRTSDLTQLQGIKNVKALIAEGNLQKVRPGPYYCPKQSRFGTVPPDAYDLVKAYLKTDQFLITSFNEYNNLGIGTTQLYNETIVYNHKRSGVIKLGNRSFTFKRKLNFPLKLTSEFLMIDLVNNIDLIAEEPVTVLENVKRNLSKLDRRTVKEVLTKYCTADTRRKLSLFLS
jgi:hypothetical protein